MKCPQEPKLSLQKEIESYLFLNPVLNGHYSTTLLPRDAAIAILRLVSERVEGLVRITAFGEKQMKWIYPDDLFALLAGDEG